MDGVSSTSYFRLELMTDKTLWTWSYLDPPSSSTLVPRPTTVIEGPLHKPFRHSRCEVKFPRPSMVQDGVWANRPHEGPDPTHRKAQSGSVSTARGTATTDDPSPPVGPRGGGWSSSLGRAFQWRTLAPSLLPFGSRRFTTLGPDAKNTSVRGREVPQIRYVRRTRIDIRKSSMIRNRISLLCFQTPSPSLRTRF